MLNFWKITLSLTCARLIALLSRPRGFRRFDVTRRALAVVFEDDTATGYLYGLDQQAAENPIQQALHIYNVQNTTDRDRESAAAIVWSADGQKACLLINDYPHAVFDFEAKRGYCRSNSPPPGKWSAHDFKWDDAILTHFR